MLRHRAVLSFLGLAGLLGAGVAMSVVSHRAAPDTVLASQFGAAFADADTSWTSLPPNVRLSGFGGGEADRVLAPGATITIAGKDGRPQVIKVTGLEVIDGDRLGVPGIRFQLVTGHAAEDVGGGLVRFMFASEAPATVGPRLKSPVDRVL